MFPSDVLYMYYYNPHYGLICVMPLIKVTQPEKNMIQSSQMCSDLKSYYGDGLFFFFFLEKLEENYIYPHLWLDGFLNS